MKLPDITLNYIDHLYVDNIGCIIHIYTITEKTVLFFIKRKIRKFKYYWRPARILLSKEGLKYTEYNLNRHILGNVWLLIKNDDTSPELVDGFPDVSLLRYYNMSRVPYRSKLENELTKLYGLEVIPF